MANVIPFPPRAHPVPAQLTDEELTALAEAPPSQVPPEACPHFADVRRAWTELNDFGRAQVASFAAYLAKATPQR